MARLTSITSKDQVPAKHQAAVEAIIKSRGAIQGPFTMFLHRPDVAERVAHLGAYVRFEGDLDMRVRVLAAMTVAREFDAMYVWGAQTGGARKLKVSEDTITAIRENHSRGHPGRGRADRRLHAGPAPQASRGRRHREGDARALR